MFKKLFMLFKIGRKLSTSGAISSIYQIYNPPFIMKILFFIIGFNFGNKKNLKEMSTLNGSAIKLKLYHLKIIILIITQLALVLEMLAI